MLKRKKSTWTILFILSGLSLGILAVVAWLFPRQVLTLDSGWVTADAMVVLGGGSDVRPQKAAALFKSGAAPRIILTGADDWQRNQVVLTKNGVPEPAIAVEPMAKSTFENAKFSVPLLQSTHARRVILVTSWYHTRRALQSFRHFAPDMTFYASPVYLDDAGEALTRARLEEMGYMRKEYAKLLVYWLWHGVCPFDL